MKTYQLTGTTLEFAESPMDEEESRRDGVILRVTGMITNEEINTHGMIVENEAIAESVVDYLRFPQVLWDHNWGQVVGKATRLEQMGDGWWMEADILDTAMGRDVALTVKAGAVRGFSMGIAVTDDHFDRDTGLLTVKEARLQEVSLTGRPSNPSTVAQAILADYGIAPESVNKDGAKLDRRTVALIAAGQFL